MHFTTGMTTQREAPFFPFSLTLFSYGVPDGLAINRASVSDQRQEHYLDKRSGVELDWMDITATGLTFCNEKLSDFSAIKSRLGWTTTTLDGAAVDLMSRGTKELKRIDGRLSHHDQEKTTIPPLLPPD